MRLLWWPFRVLGWLVVAAVAFFSAFDHDDDPGGDPRSLARGAQKPHPMRPFGQRWPGEYRR